VFYVGVQGKCRDSICSTMPEQLTPKATPIIEGDGLLQTIQWHNQADNLGLVYRGSHQAVDIVKPSVPSWSREGISYPDSEFPVVCADETPLVPAFFAIAPIGRRACFLNSEGGLDFLVFRDCKERFYHGMGYVAILAADEFKLFEGGPPPNWPWDTPPRGRELRAKTNQIPLFNYRARAGDFLQLLADNPSSSLRFITRDFF
jgi:hypothetical protein